MKLGRILRDSPDGKTARLVMVEPSRGRVIDLRAAAALHYVAKRHATPSGAHALAAVAFPGSMAQALSLGDLVKEQAAEVAHHRGDDASLPIGSVEWLSASDPPVLRDEVNFLAHLKGWAKKMNRKLPEPMERVIAYCQNSPSMAIGHESIVPWPGYIKHMDYELELGWVIGRLGHNLTPDNSLECMFGVTLYNDFSGRNLQADEVAIGMGGTKAKNFAHGIGPWITTMDEIPDLYAIPLEVRVNGVTKAKSNSGGTLWKISEALAFMSLSEWLQPGDVIGSGTVGGGSGLEIDLALQPGDVVELEAGGIGVLRNTMGQPQPVGWWPTPQTGVLS